MGRFSAYLLPVVVVAMAFSSCTCQEEGPPPPAAELAKTLPTRPAGFGIATTPTVAVATPVEEMEPEEEPTEAAEPVVEIPEDFPEDVPIFEGAELAAVQDLAGDAHNVLFRTDAPATEVFEFYREDLRGKGYELTQEYATDDQSFLSFQKGQLITNVIIARDPHDKSRRVIAIMYQVEEEIEEF
jgi:hypothetical protein